MAFDKPQSRNEAILQNMLGANNELEPPKSRVEALLQDIAGQMPEANPSEGTTTGTLERLKIGDEIYTVEGGGSGTSDYDALNNKPQIAGVTLSGDKSLADLGIASATTVSGILDGTDIDSFGDVETALGAIQDGQSIDSFADVETALSAKQNATDNSLDTTAKTIVGAINEHEGDITSLKSGFTTLDNEVNGDAVVYPYADVITIEDAVPSNLADCTVKIEPVQDLHGYDKPWVGGADKNKFATSFNNVDTQYITCDEFIVDADNYVFKFKNTSSSDISFWAVDTSDITDTTNHFVAAGQTASVNYTVGAGGKVRISMRYNPITAGITPADISEVALYKANDVPDTYRPYTNICPITGHTEASVQRDGKNLFDKNSADIQPWYIGGTDHKIGFNANTRSIIIPCNPSTTYTISKTAGTTLRAASIESASYAEFTQTAGYIANNTGSSLTITTTTNAQYLITTVRGSDDTVSVDDMINSVQFELGSSATDYEPFRGKTYTIALGDTIYGGTVDFDSGVMTVTHGYCKVPSNVEWTYKDTYGGFFFSEGSTYAPGLKANSVNISNMLETVTDISTFEGKANAIYTVSELNFKVSGINTVSDFETWLDNNDLYVCYELATPTTTQLTPQQIQLLKGTNTLTASTGQISVTVNGVSGAIGSVQEQVNEIASDKQDKTDNALNTTAKTVVGGINELASGLTNATTVSSGTITAQEGITITRYILQKSIKTVFLFMLVKFTPTLGTGQLLCVLPSGYRAPDRLLFVGKNGTTGKLVTCETDSYGAVRVYPTSDDSTEVSTDYFLTITYFVS